MPSGEVWLIDDPGLRLGELQNVQEEVVRLLAPEPKITASAEASPVGEA
jgi:hypothetical protein